MRTITTQELKNMKEKQEGFALVNVLSQNAFEQKHIPGSHNVPGDSDDFEKQMDTLVPDKKYPVVVYCTNKSCNASPNAARKLEAAGFSDVLDYEGGLEAWDEADQPLRGTAVRA